MWTCYTFPRRPKNRLDFAGGFRFTHGGNQTVVQVGSRKRYFQIMAITKKVTVGGVSYLHFTVNTPRHGKLVWLRLSNRPSLWLFRIGRLKLPPRRR